ncbi:MAG TPA: hypothetical protein VGK48_09360 [Terriglobia bacterium]
MQGPVTAPLMGTWTLNLAKSTYQRSLPPRSFKMVVEEREDGKVVIRSEAVLAGGSKNATVSIFKCDGKNYPFLVHEGKDVDTLSMSCMVRGAGTYELRLMDGYEEVQKTERMVAADGRTMTDTISTQRPDGVAIQIVAVYEKQ